MLLPLVYYLVLNLSILNSCLKADLGHQILVNHLVVRRFKRKMDWLEVVVAKALPLAVTLVIVLCQLHVHLHTSLRLSNEELKNFLHLRIHLNRIRHFRSIKVIQLFLVNFQKQQGLMETRLPLQKALKTCLKIFSQPSFLSTSLQLFLRSLFHLLMLRTLPIAFLFYGFWSIF